MEEVLVHDVIEEILYKLPVKSLMRFKSVSKQWKSTIESPNFQEKHLSHHQNSKKSDLLSINTGKKSSSVSIITLESKSSISNRIRIPCEINFNKFCQNSCDGLICLYNDKDSENESVIIYNPATRWYRILPPSIYQQRQSYRELNRLGFGKDQITTGLYKPVWLYNSLELNSDNATTCEVFDFNSNAWRFVKPSSPHRIIYWSSPIYLNGLLYWLTEEKEEEIRSVLSLDLHTETFEIVCKAPFRNTICLYNFNDNLCGLDDMGHIEVIWWLNLEEKTWNKLYNIDLLKICPFFGRCWCSVSPLALMGENKMLMLYNNDCCSFLLRKRRLMIYESETTSSHEVSTGDFSSRPVCYFQSLISIL